VSLGWQVVREGTVSTGNITYTFELVRNATTDVLRPYGWIWMAMALLISRPSLVRVAPGADGEPAGSNPFRGRCARGLLWAVSFRALDFRIGTALAYTQNVRIIFWQTTISALEGM